MSVNDYRHLLTITKQTTTTDDGHGHNVAPYVEVGTVFASISEAGDEIEESHRTTDGKQYVIKCLYHPELTADCKLESSTTTYNVLGIDNRDLRFIELSITAGAASD